MEESYANVTHEFIETYSHPFIRLFPFLKQHPIIDPIYTAFRNADSSINCFLKTAKESSVKTSLYHRLVALGTISEVDVGMDLIGLLAAGMDTLSDLITGAFYHLKKAPKKLEILMAEMEKCGLDVLRNKDLTESEIQDTLEKIQS